MSDDSLPTITTVPDSIVPRPRLLQRGEGRFGPGERLRIFAPVEAEAPLARLLAGLAKRKIAAEKVPRLDYGADLVFEQETDALAEPSEAYRLSVTETGVRIRAKTAAGWGHGVQTFLDLSDRSAGDWPVVSVVDGPCFAWRGMLLDCCRHFVSLAGIRRILDGMAACKLNRLHWHLTDDQAWRIEIKRYPRLTEVGASRSDEGGGRPQFYTQEEIRDLVAYARNLGIDIVPEIEMPGHATSALAAYPELGCHRDPVSVEAAWGIFPQNYNAGDDRVFDFLENVLREVIELFPFPYVHLGADECQKAQWQDCPDCQRRMAEEGLADEDALQSYFVNRIAKFLRQHGRTAIGWDEILEGEPLPGMLVQAWRDERIIKLAASRGFGVIASPRRFCYLDMAISQLDLRDIRGFDPTAGLDVESAKMILGAEANMWTEYVHESELEHMIFPRLWGLSEALWCGAENPSPFDEFKARVDRLTERARADGLVPGPALRDEIPAEQMKGRTDLNVPAKGVDKLA